MRPVLLFTVLLFSQFLGAQTFTLSGKIVDDNQSPLPGATVRLQYPWGDPVKNTVSDADGQFRISGLERGGYALKIKAVGFSELSREVTLRTADVALGALALEPDPVVLGGVEITGTVPIAQQRGDTTEFNANAVKVMRDASAEDLVEKLPTVTIESGQIKAQGENVGRVLVDGKEFFGSDPAAALKNLPAEVVERVQIFDAQSDQSQFTGFQDGNTTKTINIVTKTGMRNGQFGKVYAGYGYDGRYQAGGNINLFDGNRRISFIGMVNNINIQNFSYDDILGVMGSGGRGGRFRSGGGGMGGGMRSGGGPTGDFLVRPSGGITETAAVGLNYADQWGKKVEVNASYFFNHGNTDAETVTFRQFFADTLLTEVYQEDNSTQSRNTNHRFNGRITIQLDSSNSLVLRPRLSLQVNSGTSSIFGETAFQNDPLRQTDNRYFSDLTGLNLNNSLLWRHKFGKAGRTVSVDFSQGYAPKNGNSSLLAANVAFVPPFDNDTLDQIANLDVNSWNLAGNVEYTEPLSANSQLLLNYRLSYQQEASDKQTYDFFAPDQGYTLLNEPLTNVFSNDYTTHQTGAGYNFSRGRDLNFNFRTNLQWAQLNNTKTFPTQSRFGQTFFNVLPSAMLRYNLDANRNIRLFYRSNTSLPTVEQLQDVVDNSNTLQLRVGNPDLKQSFQHNLFFRFQASNPEKSSTFFGMAGGGFTADYIANATYLGSSDHPIFQQYEVPRGAQISRPVNLDGYWTARSFLSYGKPIKGLKTNVNLDLSYNYSRSPGLINDALNYAENHSVGLGLTFASNISDRVDFTLSGRPSWNRVRNSLQTNSNTDYLNHSTRLKFNWIILEGFVLRTDLTHTLYSGLSDGFNQNYWLWNLGIGKKILKNERGEITLAINDLLRQNRNISRNITETYIEDVQSNALQQFIMLSFTYNLRNFNTGKASTRKEEERHGDWGPPPGRGL